MSITAQWSMLIWWIISNHLVLTLIIVLIISMAITEFLPRKIHFLGLMPGILFVTILLVIYFFPYIIVCSFVWFLIMILMDYDD